MTIKEWNALAKKAHPVLRKKTGRAVARQLNKSGETTVTVNLDDREIAWFKNSGFTPKQINNKYEITI